MFYPFLKLKNLKVKNTFKEIHRHALSLEKKKEIKLGKNNKITLRGMIILCRGIQEKVMEGKLWLDKVIFNILPFVFDTGF